MTTGTAPAPAEMAAWLLGLLMAFIGIMSVAGVGFSRPFLLAPVLLALVFVSLHTRTLARTSCGLTLAFAAYLAVLGMNIFFFHPELATLANFKGLVMLALGWGGFLAALQTKDSKPLLTGIAVTEFLLVGQIWLSFFTGWGEIIDSRDGIRRAYGWAGDGYSPLLVFLVLTNLFHARNIRAVIGTVALFMTGGKMSIMLAFLCFLVALPLAQKRMMMALTFAASLILGMLVIDPDMRLTTAWETTPAPLVPGTQVTDPAPPPATRRETTSAPLVPGTQVTDPAPPPATTRKTTSAAEYLVNGAAATGLGRIISASAGWHMLHAYPAKGVGFGQSGRPEIFQPAVLADAFGLQQKWKVHTLRLLAEKDISNQTILTAAELGVPGAITFAIFCLLAVLACCKTWIHARSAPPASDMENIRAVAAIWCLVLIVFNQTAPWLLPGAATTLWLCIMLGLAVSWPQKQTC